MRKRIVMKQPEMKVDIGVKISLINGGDDDLTSCNLWITKDRSFPLFLSGETETMFVITAHLKGFVRDNVGMKINEQGTQITISWKKPVWEIVMREGNVHKEAKMVGFTEAFRVPDGVVLDRMEANFTEHDSKLTISMPKLVRELNTIEQVDDNDIKTTQEKVTYIDQVGENKGGDEVIAEMRTPTTDTKHPHEKTLQEDMEQHEHQDIKEEPSVESLEPIEDVDMASPTPTQQNEAEGKKCEMPQAEKQDVQEQEQEPSPASPVEGIENGVASLEEEVCELGEVKTRGFSKVIQASAVLVTSLALVLQWTRVKKR